MPNYHRNQAYGGCYFFTLVTQNRTPYFSENANAEIFLRAIRKTQKRKPFDLIAYCLLHDHLHLLVALPNEDNSFSQKIRSIKRITTLEIRKLLGKPDLVIWQDRFWEHTIRDEKDFKNHFDYIHYNPVKHGYVVDYADWVWSSYREYYVNESKMARIDPVTIHDDNICFGE